VDGESGQRSRVVRVAHRDHGGRGEAATELENFVCEIQSEQFRAENQVRTVGEVITSYIEHCRRIGRRRGTVESYEMVAKRITTEMKAKPIDTLTGRDFDEFYGDLARTLGANTIRQTHAVLHAAFDQAVKWGWMAANPMSGATPPGRFRPRREALAMGDVHKMIQRESRLPRQPLLGLDNVRSLPRTVGRSLKSRRTRTRVLRI
jgi:site-specific recombinase XerD